MMSSISWAWFSSILQPKQLQVIVHPRTLSLHWFICSTVFQRVSVDIWTWPCSYWLHCGLHTQLQRSFLHTSYFTITPLIIVFAVQRYSASDFLIPSNCSNYSCLLLGLNFETWRQLNPQRQWETLVGKVQELQS